MSRNPPGVKCKTLDPSLVCTTPVIDIPRWRVML
jgi:hypothetical protein